MIPAIQEQMGGEVDIENEAFALIDDGLGAISIRQVAGVVDQDELPRLRKLIFRGTRGKSYVYVQQILNQPSEDGEEQMTRAVFICVYWSGNHIRDKLYKICDSFNCNRYDLPGQREIRTEL